MADILISDLGAMAEAVHKDNDMLALQNVSSGETVKVSTQQLLDTVSSLTAMTDAVATTDVLVIHDTSAGVTKKVTPQQLFDIAPSLVTQGRDGGDIGGYLMDGGDDYITVADNANLDFGLSDFSIELFVRLADYTPAAELVLLEKHASILGYKLLLTTAGKLKLQFGNGTNFTTFSYESDATAASDDSWAHFLVTADRDGNALYYVNGNLNKTVDISGSVGQTLDNTGALNIFGNGTSYTGGKVALVRVYNRVLTESEIQSIYNNGRPDLYELPYQFRGAVITPKYTSDYSSGVDGYTQQISCTIAVGTASQDGITDGVTSYDNVLSFWANSDNAAHAVSREMTAKSKRTIEKFKIYIPSANTNTDGFELRVAASAVVFTLNSLTVTKVVDGTSFGTISTNQVRAMKGFWAQVIADITYGDRFSTLHIRQIKTNTATFVGANSATDDLVYVYDYTSTAVGNCLEYNSHNAGSLGWIESSGNQLSGSTSGSPICLTKEARPPHYRDIRKAIAANTNTTLTGIVPRGYKIVSIRAKGSDSLADIKIGSASAGEQIVAATTTSSTTPKLLTLAATANDAYSESADVTLYARHDTGASGKTMDLIFHFEKVGN